MGLATHQVQLRKIKYSPVVAANSNSRERRAGQAYCDVCGNEDAKKFRNNGGHFIVGMSNRVAYPLELVGFIQEQARQRTALNGASVAGPRDA